MHSAASILTEATTAVGQNTGNPCGGTAAQVYEGAGGGAAKTVPNAAFWASSGNLFLMSWVHLGPGCIHLQAKGAKDAKVPCAMHIFSRRYMCTRSSWRRKR